MAGEREEGGRRPALGDSRGGGGCGRGAGRGDEAEGEEDAGGDDRGAVWGRVLGSGFPSSWDVPGRLGLGIRINVQAVPTLVKEPVLTRERRRVNISAHLFSFRFHLPTPSLGKATQKNRYEGSTARKRYCKFRTAEGNVK